MNWADTRSLVEAHATADLLERSHRQGLLDLFDRFPDPWNRDRFEPGHLTASAFVVHPDGSAVALIHHAKLDRWLQPGGHVEHDDVSHESAARREVAEECLIHSVDAMGPIDVDVHRFPARGGEPAHLHFDLRWAFVARGTEMGAGDGTLAVRWVPLGEMAQMGEAGLVRTARKLARLRLEEGAP